MWKQNKPTDEIGYDHYICKSPMGDMVIIWESWKDKEEYDLTIDDKWVGHGDDLEKTKEMAINYLRGISSEIENFLKDYDIQDKEYTD